MPRENLPPWSCFFIGTLSQPLTLRAFLFNPPDPLSKGAIRACGLSIAAGPSLPASSGPASYDALFILRSVLFRYVMQLGRTLTLRAAFASSTYLLPQRGEQNRLFCLRRWILVCKYGLSAHVMLFLNCHGRGSWVFAPVIGFTCANKAFLPLSSFIDIVPHCGPNCGKSPLSSGGFTIRRVLCRCSARRIARYHLAPIKVCVSVSAITS